MKEFDKELDPAYMKKIYTEYLEYRDRGKNIDKQIPISELEIGHWYEGKGVNGDIGCWNGKSFTVLCQIGIVVSWQPRQWTTKPGTKYEPYFTGDTEYMGCFQPFFRISDTDKLAELSLELDKIREDEIETAN